MQSIYKFCIELIAPTTAKTTEHYMDGTGNGKKSKDSHMAGDYGVEEWRDGGKCIFCSLQFQTISMVICFLQTFTRLCSHYSLD